jgi:hypothetical protein
MQYLYVSVRVIALCIHLRSECKTSTCCRGRAELGYDLTRIREWRLAAALANVIVMLLLLHGESFRITISHSFPVQYLSP